MKSGTCPKCQSKRIMANLSVPDRFDYGMSSDSRLTVAANPDAIFFKNTVESIIKAFVCADCGLVEQYIQNPGALWRAYEKANSGS